MPVDASAPAAEIERALTTARPHLLISGDERLELPDGTECLETTAAVLLTSGSTGVPKPVELSHAALRSAVVATHTRLGVTPDDRWLCCLPVHHVAGFAILVRAAILGTPPEIHDAFEVDSIRHHDSTLVSFVPTQLRRLLDEGVDLRAFKHVLLGGAAIPPSLLDDARAAGANVVRTYGMTETCGGVIYDGRPLDGVDVRIAADSTIELRTPSLFSRYRGMPDLTDRALADGWFKTADIGSLQDGDLVVTGRADEMIVTGGEKVAPAEVEAVLLRHPGVVEAVVFGVDDPEWGTATIAAVVPGPVIPELDELFVFVRSLLAAHKVPKQIHLIGSIPKLTSGKPDVEALERLLLA